MSEPTSESVWSLRADELLRRTASPEPTPGNGSIAPVSGALGIGLVLMALAITDEPPAALRERGDALLSSVVATADRDVTVFRAVLDARGMPERDEAERAARGDAIERATLTAAEVPLDLATALRDALELAADAEPLVKPALVSDVRAGADIIAGAARAALRATELNLEVLERSGSAAARSLRARHDALVSALQRR